MTISPGFLGISMDQPVLPRKTDTQQAPKIWKQSALMSI
jgi:hypothetical protein